MRLGVQNRYAVLEAGVGSDKAEEHWNILVEAIWKGEQETISDNRRREKKPWMTEDILDTMDERKQLKGREIHRE